MLFRSGLARAYSVRDLYIDNGLYELALINNEQNYIPKVGDYMVLNTSHICIVTGYDVETGIVYTVEGNMDDKVGVNCYYYYDTRINGYCCNGGTEITTENVTNLDSTPNNNYISTN